MTPLKFDYYFVCCPQQL